MGKLAKRPKSNSSGTLLAGWGKGSMASGRCTARAAAPDESPHTGAVTFGKWTAFANPAQLEVSYGEKSPNLCLLPPSKLPLVQLNPMGNPREKGVAHRAGWRGKSGCGGARKHSVQSLPCTPHERHRAAVPAAAHRLEGNGLHQRANKQQQKYRLLSCSQQTLIKNSP